MKPNFHWAEVPMVRLLVPFVLGAVAAFNGLVTSLWLTAAAVLSVTLLLLTRLLKTRLKFRLAFWVGVMVQFSLFLIGCLYTQYYFDKNKTGYFGENPCQAFRVRLLEQPVVKNTYYRSEAEVVHVFDKQEVSTRGKLMVYLHHEGGKAPRYGDVVDINSNFQQVDPPRNPGGFDYQKYLRYKNINHLCFAGKDEWIVVDSGRGSSIRGIALQVSARLQSKIDELFHKKEDRAILKALLLGEKGGLDQQLKTSFSRTGTIHVLAVSGLHVGVIFLLTTFLLSTFGFKEKGWLMTLSILAVLWTFALITGFSPSVSRASLMFSILAIGNALGRKTNIYNTLACSAFVLLLINPLNLMNLGFQFSYLAVLGIVTLQRPIRNLFHTKSWFLDKVYGLLAVSVAAQLATFPLGLYYFHQLSLIFFLSNLIVVPAITVILYGLILTLILGGVAVLGEAVAYVVEAYLWFIRTVVYWFEHIPFAYIQGVPFSIGALLTTIVMVLSIVWLVNREKRFWPAAVLFLCIACLLVIQIVQKQTIRNSSELVWLDLGKSSVLVYRKGEELILLNGAVDKDDWDYTVKPYFVDGGLYDPKFGRKVKDSTITGFSINQVRVGLIKEGAAQQVLAEGPYDVLWLQSIRGFDWQQLLSVTSLIYLDQSLDFQEANYFRNWHRKMCSEKPQYPKVISGFVSYPE